MSGIILLLNVKSLSEVSSVNVSLELQLHQDVFVIGVRRTVAEHQNISFLKKIHQTFSLTVGYVCGDKMSWANTVSCGPIGIRLKCTPTYTHLVTITQTRMRYRRKGRMNHVDISSLVQHSDDEPEISRLA